MPAIKAKRPRDVKLRRFFALAVALGFSTIARAENPPPPPETPPAPAANGAPASSEPLPDIEAKTYEISAVRHSKSGKVHLFNDGREELPPVGRIVLLKKDGKAVMAFRVLRTYPDAKQFAATRVRVYPGTTDLVSGQSYSVLEKISDVVPPPPTESEKTDLAEIEDASAASKSASGEYRDDEILAYDPELDAGSSPPPGGIATDAETLGQEDDDDEPGEAEDPIAVEEIEPLDSDMSWLTFTLALIRNTPPPPLTAGYFTGGGIRYGYTIRKTPYFRKAKLQDSIVLEGSVFYYNVSNLVSLSDSYTVVPILATVRYNLLVSDSLAAFAYAGFGKNFVVASSGPDSPPVDVAAYQDSVAALGSFMPAAGVGLIYRVGPSWDVRMDLGFDVLGLGLMLRF